jgi:hypothetical protein
MADLVYMSTLKKWTAKNTNTYIKITVRQQTSTATQFETFVMAANTAAGKTSETLIIAFKTTTLSSRVTLGSFHTETRSK